MSVQRTYRTQVALSTTVRDIFGDSDLQVAPALGFLNIYGRQATGAGTLLMNVRIGTEVVAEDLEPTKAAGNPNRRDDVLLNLQPVMPGQRIKVDLAEQDGTATTPNIIMEFLPA